MGCFFYSLEKCTTTVIKPRGFSNYSKFLSKKKKKDLQDQKEGEGESN